MEKDKRKLTDKELKRKDHFEKLNAEMQQKGYQIKNMIIDIQQANLQGPLSMLPFMVLVFGGYYYVNGLDIDGISIGIVAAAYLLILVHCIIDF